MDEPKKTVMFCLRLAEEELARWRAEAHSNGRPTSQWLRWLANKEAAGAAH